MADAPHEDSTATDRDGHHQVDTVSDKSDLVAVLMRLRESIAVVAQTRVVGVVEEALDRRDLIRQLALKARA